MVYTSSIQSLKNGLDDHKALLKSFAKRLAVGGDMETAQQTLDLFNENQQLKNNKSRTEMMDLAEKADAYQAYIHEYEAMDGKNPEQVKALEKRIADGTQEDDDDENGGEEKTRVLQEAIAEILGIAFKGGNANGEEDELEVTIVHKDDSRSLHCPLTRQLYENPVKNSVCGHSYEKEAIMQHLRISSRKECPVAGCSNTNVKPEQLTENVELVQEVRRHKRRAEKRNEQNAMSQALGLDSDEEEDTEV